MTGRRTTRYSCETMGGRSGVIVAGGAPLGAAREALAPLRDGARGVCAITKGQFSLMHAVQAALEITGPADVRLAAWTAAKDHIKAAGVLVDTGVVRSLRLYMDRSFSARQPLYAAVLNSVFGSECVRVTKLHAKLATIRGDRCAIALRSSMNLTTNPRVEQLDADVDEGLCDFIDGVFAEVDAGTPEGVYADQADVVAAYDRLLRGLPIVGGVVETEPPPGCPLDGKAGAFRSWVTRALAANRRGRERPSSLDAVAGMVGLEARELRAKLRQAPAEWRHAAVDVAHAVARTRAQGAT